MAKKHLLCPGDYYQDWSKTLSQRKAIRFAMRYQRAERSLNLLWVQF